MNGQPDDHAGQRLEMDDYEKRQFEGIETWKKERPNVLGGMLVPVTLPLSWLVRKTIPRAVTKGVIDGLDKLAKWTTDTDDILHKGQVDEICQLRKKNLKLSDDLAAGVVKWAIGMAVVEGAATGAGGIIALSVDVPIIITLALRTVHKIGLCYGYESRTENDRLFMLGLVSASVAPSYSDKMGTLATLKGIELAIARQTMATLAEKAVAEEMGAVGTATAIKSLSSRLGGDLARRKILQAIPVAGAAVGGSVNGWLMKNVGRTAQRSFQRRWIVDKYGLTDI